ncbi:hypothetical protein [Paenibacillus sp. MMS20-IR301]|uniref:hypothetical protein n=1 Tax=Paenibacillus sp. MMS20-IR301 TaxID=2895946 RepID=UPI0028EB57A5|nr:hypothetical protein [Paenibacillus sp. MMS20-IR301]WNS46308.1 hypothetical protein LOS79_13920 [Paenibacillus sp. MMS20-IR301]
MDNSEEMAKAVKNVAESADGVVTVIEMEQRRCLKNEGGHIDQQSGKLRPCRLNVALAQGIGEEIPFLRVNR